MKKLKAIIRLLFSDEHLLITKRKNKITAIVKSTDLLLIAEHRKQVDLKVNGIRILKEAKEIINNGI